MISRTKVVAVIDRAGAKFEWCWNAFSKHKEATTDSSIGRDLVAVQNELISAQWMLNVQYRAIVQEKERLIAGKQKYQGTWFSRRMARLDHYLKAIKSAIGIGKTIGDGYAWIFYHHDVHLIEQHFRRQPQTDLPPGVGGIGERAFVEKLQGFNKHFVLYHGITSFLRIGDVSFINLKTARVASIGEIKTKKSPKTNTKLHWVVSTARASIFRVVRLDKNGRKVKSKCHRQPRIVSGAKWMKWRVHLAHRRNGKGKRRPK